MLSWIQDNIICALHRHFKHQLEPCRCSSARLLIHEDKMRDFLQYTNRVKTSFFFQLSSSSMKNRLVAIVNFAPWYLLYSISSRTVVTSSSAHPEIRKCSFLRCTLY
jgi:hypothetical protein